MKRLYSISFTVTTFLSAIILSGCDRSGKDGAQAETPPLFKLLPPEQTGVKFNNQLSEKPNINVLRYEYFYNGGGVATGDVNGDGLDDIYFTGNMTENALYLNKGSMAFQDVTNAAGVAGRPGPWKTGVTMADVNGDGALDIFVCYSGKLRGEKRKKQLFINKGTDDNGVPHFTDEAEQFGLADSSYSTQASFFDYDRDGDLDMILLNHYPLKISNLDETGMIEIINKPEPLAGLRFYKNNNDHFDEVHNTGLKSVTLSYGLGVGISDVNNDGWPDVYISNDYDAPDYLYINNGDGTFTDKLQQGINHTSQFSMGNDVADMNNDGFPDIFTLDMLPEDNRRQKLLFAPDNYELFRSKLRIGLYYQYMRNMLQLNNGDGSFSEVGQLSGISNTDWSWAPLFADYDNDGWKDLFVTNGYVRDFTNMDFLKYMGDFLRSNTVAGADLLKLVQQMPASNVVNYLYRNNGDLTFTNMSDQWGLKLPSNSNGAAYADLDNDGDLDLVVNNINQSAFIYQNEADKNPEHHFLAVKLEGAGKNTQGIGTKVLLYNKGNTQYLEQVLTRGYQSSVSPLLHFGTGNASIVDSLKVIWQSGKQQVLTNVKTNQVVTLQEENATFSKPHVPFEKVRSFFAEVKSPVPFAQPATAINDFKRQPLLVNPLSFSGPCLVKSDVNGDGLEDVYAGGGSGQAAALFIQQKNGQFIKKAQPAFENDKGSEDADAVFFDANGDSFIDLYVASGGYHNYAPDDVLLQDRLYFNDGRGTFAKAADALPTMHVSKSCVRVSDFNGDGKQDLFVGGRVIPGRYPETPQSFLLFNDGSGHFTDRIATISPALQKAGMITDAAWLDLNGDKKSDLIVVGEWMPVSVYINTNGKLENKTAHYFDTEYSGWWNKLLVDDLNGDGKADLVIGNLGLNTQCRATAKEPAEMIYKDFDENGSVDPVFCFYMQGKSYPYVTRDELLDQMSNMRPRFTDYKSYADATLSSVFSEEELKEAQYLKANFFKTAYFQSSADGKFHEKALPLQVQFSPVYTITPLDYDKDGKKDLLLCGNMAHARLRFGKYDANYGVLLKGAGNGNFDYINQQQSGFNVKGDVRSVVNINNILILGLNQKPAKAYKLN